MPLMRWANGEPVTRTYVRDLLGIAAVRLGYPRDRACVHSLRVGGATALWVATGGNVMLVKRLGRWGSDAVEAYLWDLPVMTGEYTRGMYVAKTQVPWGAIYKEVLQHPDQGEQGAGPVDKTGREALGLLE